MTIITLQAEAYGLTPGQRATGASVVNTALEGETFVSANVEANYQRRGETLLFVEVNEFEGGQAAGDRIFNAARTWLSTRASDSPLTGEHSYVRVADKRPLERRNIIRRAESPDWVTVEIEQNLDA